MMEIQHERSGRKCTVKCASLTNSIFLLLELQSEFELRLFSYTTHFTYTHMIYNNNNNTKCALLPPSKMHFKTDLC